MPVSVRNYAEKDRQLVRNICIETSDMDKSTPQKREFILSLYCDYYIDNEPYNCFVAVNENDEAVGYIICGENFDCFKKLTKEKYLKKAKISSFERILAAGDIFITQLYRKEYPAHLHIDILPEYQRQGVGHLLMNALVENLKSKNIRGVMLCVGTKNIKGMSFYKKYGFEKRLSVFGAAVMALKTN